MVYFDKNWLAKAIVEAAPDDVFAEIAELREKKIAALGVEYRDAHEIDAEHRTSIVTGHWWHRGSITVQGNEKGSTVTYRVENIASPKTHWLAYLHKLNYSARMKQELAKILRQCCVNLGCAFRMDH